MASPECHVCGPVKHECPTVICAPCALAPSSEFSRSAREAAQHRQERIAVESGWVELDEPSVSASDVLE
jgi:hypothetical protein